MALAGGVNALLLPDCYVGFCRMGMLSPDGRCRVRRRRAGMARCTLEGGRHGRVPQSPGVAASPTATSVYARVIRGTAMNQDGRTPGMAVRGQEAQSALLLGQADDARVAPATIQYVEAHALHGHPRGRPDRGPGPGRQVLSDGRVRRSASCPHRLQEDEHPATWRQELASPGWSQRSRAWRAVHHRRIPGNLHFDRPQPGNRLLQALASECQTHCQPWPPGDGPALALVNAFGFGGTNAHVASWQQAVCDLPGHPIPQGATRSG